MFTFTLPKGSNPGDDLVRLVDKIANPGNAQKRTISDAIRRGLQDNFTTAGAAAGTPWRPLAPSTVLQRQRLGYAGSNPILVRSGGLRATWTQEGASGHYSSVRQQSGYTIWEEGADDSNPIARIHELGGARIPARPVSMLGESQDQRIVDSLEFMVASIEREVMGR